LVWSRHGSGFRFGQRLRRSTPAPTVVGGQAVNLWAIDYLPEVPKSVLVSGDLDVVVASDIAHGLNRIPGWLYQPNDTRNWADSRLHPALILKNFISLSTYLEKLCSHGLLARLIPRNPALPRLGRASA
jgi:hypothetical protein